MENLFEQTAKMEELGRSLLQPAIDAAQRKAKRLSRMDDLVEIAEFIGKADLLECKHIINMLIERVSDLTGCASELEDAACALTKEINSRDERMGL